MNYAIILSGGIGTRMRDDGFPKQYIEVKGKPILMYTLETFEKNADVDQIMIVAAESWHEEIWKWARQYKIKKLRQITVPGKTRQHSILNGLEECASSSMNELDKVIIHDAVRPVVSSSLISLCFSALNETYDGCMPVIPVNDTVYQSLTGNEISNLLDRSTLFAGQAPEAFFLKKYYKINKEAEDETLINTRGTSEIAYKSGINVRLIKGEDSNFKITTPEDLRRFRIMVGDQDESI